MNRYNNIDTNQNRLHEDILDAIRQNPDASLDELRDGVLNNPASFTSPPDSLSNHEFFEYVETQNRQLLERFELIAEKITTDNNLAQEKLAESFQQYMVQHSSFIDSIIQWFSLTPFLKWIFILGLASLLGVSALVLFKFFMSKSPKLLQQPQPLVTSRFFWGIYEYTNPYNVDKVYDTFSFLKHLYKTIKYLYMGK